MRLYYTTTAKQDSPQQKPSQSLGGYKSSSPVPNSALGNLFSDLSLLTLEKNLPEYLGLVLKNERDNSVSNIKIWINNPVNNLCKYKLAVVELSSVNSFEMLPSINSKPLYAEFYDVDSEVNSIEIGPMLRGEQYGIWLERTINTESEEFKSLKNCDLTSTPLSQIEEMEIKISFTDVSN